MQTLLLSREDIKKCLDMADCLNIVEDVLNAQGRGQVAMPPKITLNIDPYQGWINAMPAFLGPQKAAGLKWAGGWLNNAQKALPYIMAEIFLIDPQTGLLKAVMEGGYITDLRTGAATGIAARYLARKDSKVLALIGAGAQGRMQLRALTRIFEFEKIIVADRMAKYAEPFADEMRSELGVAISVAGKVEEAVRMADIIVTATNSHEVLVKHQWVKNGTFIASIGSYPEIDPQILFSAGKVVVDSWAQARHRGELAELVAQGRFSQKDLFGEIAEIVSGAKPGRQSEEEIIVACLIGLGSVDIGCAAHAYETARRTGWGQTFDFQQPGR